MKKVRIGMIGYNFMGKAHSHAYRDVPFYFDLGVEPVMQTIVGRNADRVRQAASQLGWRSYETDWRRLIEREDIDVIDIGTPNDTHMEIAIAALQVGKHVLCEKPLALNASDAQKMWETAKQSNSIHMVSHNYRFTPAVQLAKQLIDEGALGDIYHIRAQYLQDWLASPEAPMSWRLRKETSGSGAHGDIMSHCIDLARFLVGEFSEVCGMMETFIPERKTESGEMERVTVDDASAFLARFEGGVMGVFEATRMASGNKNANRFEINGTKGSVRWDLEDMNRLDVSLNEERDGGAGFRSILCTEPHHPYANAYWPAGHTIGYEHTFVNLIYEFLKGIETGQNPRPDFEDGFRNQCVLEAVEHSVKKRGWVKVKY